MNDLKAQILAHMDAAAPGQVWAPADFAERRHLSLRSCPSGHDERRQKAR